MNSSTPTARTSLAAIALAAALLAPAASAPAKLYTPPEPDAPAAAEVRGGDDATAGLPRSADRATPFVAEVAPEAVRRDPGQATPFVAEAAPEATPAGDAFDWGDAAIGAGVSLLVVALAIAGSATVGSIRKRIPASGGAASQNA